MYVLFRYKSFITPRFGLQNVRARFRRFHLCGKRKMPSGMGRFFSPGASLKVGETGSLGIAISLTG